MSNYMPMYPICPVCKAQSVYVSEDEFTADDWLEMFECGECGWTGEYPDYPDDDSPEAVDAYIRTAGYVPAALVKRMQNRINLALLESPLNEDRFYFRQELVNGVFEDD